jgi:prolyl oligopeptidase
VHTKDTPIDGSVPWLLSGYGGFNVSLRPTFSTVYATWLEAGGGVAIPNLRGGGEYGKEWHEAGMREKKQNVFDDFIAAAEWLVEKGYTSPEKLAIRGGSNGGLLVSAVATQRPELYRAVLCQVPLTDMIRYHKFGLANIWSEEYGNAEEAEMFPHLLAYSPYHNVKADTKYPAMMVTGSANDARTDPVHARKFYAAIKEATSSEKPVLLKVYGESGHGGGVTIDTKVDQTADQYGFLMWQLSMSPPE